MVDSHDVTPPREYDQRADKFSQKEGGNDLDTPDARL